MSLLLLLGSPVTPTPPTPDHNPRTVSVAAYTTDGDLVATMADSFARMWMDPLNEPGTGSAQLPHGDPDIDLIDFGHVLRFSLNHTVKFAALVESKRVNAIAAGEEASQAVTFSGRGTLAILDQAVVWPDLGVDRVRFSDTRVFNFANPDLDDSAWTAAVETPASNYGGPNGWPDPTAEWIWDQDSSTSVPLGDVYLRKTFTAGSSMNVDLSAAADDAYEVWLDGIKVFEDGFDIGYLGQMKKARLQIDSGSHTVAARARNGAIKGGFRLSIQELDATGTAVSSVVVSDSSWSALGYPADPPGFTVGRVLGLLLAEAQARGALADVALGFDDDDDSNGDAWDSTPDIVLQVGRTYLEVIKQLCETYCDVRMRPDSLTLDAWTVRGETTTVALEPAVNLTELTHEGTA